MSQQELLRRVVQVLDEAGIEYMLTGSVVSSLQGEPRSTHDIDLVATIPQHAINRLTSSFVEPDFYLEPQSIVTAIASKGMFNLIDVREGDKVDFWILTPEPFDQSRFARRKTEDLFGMHVKVSSPEDTILAKLRWADLSGGSEKQFTDALRVYEVQRGVLDIRYIETWVERLGVGSLWARLLQQAGQTE